MYFRFLALALLLFCVQPNYAQNALDFDGSDDYVQTSCVPPTGNDPRTLECWIKTYYKQKQQVMIDYGFIKPNGSRFTFNMIDGKLRIEVGGEGVTGTKFIADTAWHHIAVTYDDNASPKYRTFIDGVVQDSFNISITPNTLSTVKLRFGIRVDDANPFEGLMDEVRVWNYARNHQQIKNNYNKELCSRQKGLVAYHKFNQGVAGKNNSKITTSTDLSGAGNDGDLKNFNLYGATSNWNTGVNLGHGYTSAAIKDSGCGKYKSPSGKYEWTSSGKYKDTLPNYMGCDSIISLDITVIPNPTKTITATSCKTYISPSGRYAWSKSGTYTDRIITSAGCDTLVTVYLTVSAKSVIKQDIKACNYYVSPSKKDTYTTSGIYSDTLTSMFGCDSIVVTNLSLLSSKSAINVKSCTAYTAPSGRRIYNSSGVYYDTIPNSRGCDSIIQINLTMLRASNSSQQVFACSSYTLPGRGLTITKPGTYYDTLVNYLGCDSIVQVELSFGTRYSDMDITACDQFTVPSGKQTYTKSGTYRDTVPSTKGCDSVITIRLTMHYSHTGSAVLSGCNEVSSPSGRFLYTQSGTYFDTIPTTNGCDSVLELEVNITSLHAVVEVGEKVLTANIKSAQSYQWIDCDAGNTGISGATGETFTPTKNGRYSVLISNESCSDTAECVAFNGLGVDNLSAHAIDIFPNPANDLLFVSGLTESVHYSLCNISGKIIKSGVLKPGAASIEMPSEAGCYVLTLTYHGAAQRYRIMRE